ncbi:TonB-dependent receptor [Sphingomonas sp. Root710]|uniref:TonB-dependent receptor n=1 Tax=Sphingomonas sp. Root710 TaxID=1736594 RepID=UPI0009EB6453|nr:TonB-dependent receptor [Sphingomonas sp. Root710]
MRRFLLSTAGFICIMPFSAMVQAQSADPAATNMASDDTQTGIADIVVTAERRATSAQSTPIALSAVSGEAMREKNIVDVESLATNIPNLNFSRIAADAKISIRGIGYNALGPGGETRVALYLDGIYQSRNQAGLLGFYDVDRVEVLRGPQGTLYGRNAIAGTINLLTREPGDVLNGYFTGTVGDYGLIGTEGAIGGPLSSTVEARLSFRTVDRKGYGTNISNGEDVNDEHSRSVRGKLRFEPSSSLAVSLSGDYSNVDDHSSGYRPAGRGNNAIPTLVETGGFTVPTDPQDTAGFGPRRFIKTYGFSGQADFDISSETKLTFLTGYRHFVSRQRGNLDGSTAELSKQYIDETSDVYSTELRLSQKLGSIGEIIVGGYYFHENNSASNQLGFKGLVFSDFFANSPFSPYNNPALAGIPGIGAARAAIAANDPNAMYEFYAAFGRVKTNAYAVFAQAHFDLSDQLALDLGARYSHEKKAIFEQHQTDLLSPFVPFDALHIGFFPAQGLIGLGQRSDDKTWNSFDPKITVSYKPASGIYLYATYSRGFKAGGYNVGGLQAPFRPEKLTNYEVGIKSDLFDRRLRVNLTAFNYDYKDLQESKIVGNTLVVVNADKARIRGLEAEITARPTEALMIQLNAAHLDGKFKTFLDSDQSFPALGVQNLAGNQVPDAPKYTVGGEVGYTISTGFGDITPRVNVTWMDRVYFNHFNTIERSQPSRTMVNLFLGWTSLDKSLTASAYIKNLTNDTYFVGTNTNAPLLGSQRTASLGAPRTVGLSVTKTF